MRRWRKYTFLNRYRARRPSNTQFSRGDKVQSRCALSGSAHRTVSLQRQMLVKQVVQKVVEDGCHDRVVDIPVV